MLEKVGNVNPYRVGDRLKVYLSDAGVSTGSATCTFGRVVFVQPNGQYPRLEYEDYSQLPLARFNRFVGLNDVSFMPRPRKKNPEPYETFININGELVPIDKWKRRKKSRRS